MRLLLLRPLLLALLTLLPLVHPFIQLPLSHVGSSLAVTKPTNNPAESEATTPTPQPRCVPTRNADTESLNADTELLKYEQSILSQWFEPSKQRGFNWFLEKLRRNASCLKTSPSKQGELSRPGRDWTFSPARTPVAVPIQKQLLSPLDTMNVSDTDKY